MSIIYDTAKIEPFYCNECKVSVDDGVLKCRHGSFIIQYLDEQIDHISISQTIRLKQTRYVYANTYQVVAEVPKLRK